MLIVHCSFLTAQAQPRSFGINNTNPNSKASLDVGTTSGFKQGFLMPRLTTADTNNIGVTAGKDKGMMFFDTLSGVVRYWNGTKWGSGVVSASSGDPAGTIVAYGGATVPTGYLVCDGFAVSRTTYSDLFTAIGIAWGSGNGSSTFNLPDLRGRFLRGVDGGSGNDPDASSRTAINSGGNTGNNVGSAERDALQNITGHIATIPVRDGNTTYNGAFHREGAEPTNASGLGSSGSPNIGFDASLVARTSTETRPINAYVYYIIKYTTGGSGGSNGGSGTDSQTLSLAGNNLSISNGNSVTLPTELPATASAGQVLKYKGGQWKAGTDSTGGTKLAVYQEYYTSPSSYPSSALTTLNAWVSIPLNTTQFASNTTDIAISGSTITLQRGTYRLHGFSNFDIQGSGSATYEFKSRLLNNTSSTTAVWGSKELSNSNISNIDNTLTSNLEGIVTVASATTFTFQRYVYWTTTSSLQLGITTFSNTPGDQVLLQLSIERLY